MLVFLGFAISWNQAPDSKTAKVPGSTQTSVITQLFPLVYPLFVLFMSAQIAHDRVALASAVVLISFACSSARLLMTQARQQQSTQALVRQTVLWKLLPTEWPSLTTKACTFM